MYSSKLIFKNAQLKKVIEHTITATQWKVGLAEAIAAWQKATGKDWQGEDIPDQYYTSEEPTIFFVKDSGIYLMTGAKLPELPKDGSHVCYATGYEPSAKNSWEKCRDAVGGDDFAETLTLSAKLKADILAGDDVVIKVTEDKITVSVVTPKS